MPKAAFPRRTLALAVLTAACSAPIDPSTPADPAGEHQSPVFLAALPANQAPIPRPGQGNLGPGLINEWSRKADQALQGWSYPLLVDINDDQYADLCGVYDGRYGCVRNVSRTGFVNGQNVSYRVFDGAFIPASGFDSPNGSPLDNIHSTVTAYDHNDDDRMDLCGRTAAGMVCQVSQGTTTAPSFGNPITVLTNFSDANGWDRPEYYSTIRFGSLLERRAICGRGSAGLHCFVRAPAAATYASGVITHTGNFHDGFGWNQQKAYETLDFVDINTDGNTDACGRGNDGILCSTFIAGATRTFGTASYRTQQFRDAWGWWESSYFRTVIFGDLNNDGRIDVCGRGNDGLYCGRFGANGNVLPEVMQVAISGMRDAAGWAAPFPSANRVPILADADGDGRRDVCAVGPKAPSSNSNLPTIWCSRNLSATGGALGFGVLAPRTSEGTGLSGNRRVARGRLYGDQREGFCWASQGNVWCTEAIAF